MAVMDEFREEREALKNADLKTKWRYFLDYYKWYVIGGVAVIFFIGSYVHSALTAKDYVLTGYFLNTYVDTVKNTEFASTFAEAAGINSDKYDLMLDTSLQFTPGSLDETSYAAQQKLMVMIAAKEVDFIAADETAFLQYASTDTFFDLREIYTEEELEKFCEYIYYIDMDVVREKEAIIDSGNFEDYVAPEYDHFVPEEMGDPVPMGLCIQDSPKIKDTFYFKDGPVPMAVIVNTQHLETTKIFIDYMFEGLVQK